MCCGESIFPCCCLWFHFLCRQGAGASSPVQRARWGWVGGGHPTCTGSTRLTNQTTTHSQRTNHAQSHRPITHSHCGITMVCTKKAGVGFTGMGGRGSGKGWGREGGRPAANQHAARHMAMMGMVISHAGGGKGLDSRGAGEWRLDC